VRLTKERKAYAVVFGLGLMALAADRLFFAPAGAEAAAPDAAGEPQRVAAQAPPTEPAAPTGPSFAERLGKRASWGDGPVRDAFVAPVAWVGARTSREAPEAALSPTIFAEKHRATLVTKVTTDKGDRGMAVVDGKVVYLHGTLDGYQLVDINASKEHKSAIFERNGERVELLVSDKPGESKTDKPGP
jgi:hypothetical protein